MVVACMVALRRELMRGERLQTPPSGGRSTGRGAEPRWGRADLSIMHQSRPGAPTVQSYSTEYTHYPPAPFHIILIIN